MTGSGAKPDESERDQISQNIDAVLEFYTREDQKISRSQRILERISHFTEQPAFLGIILCFVALWIVANVVLQHVGMAEFDPKPYFWLQGIVGLGALLTATVVLSKQSRFADTFLVTTEDSTLGTKGFVTAPLAEMLADPARVPRAVFAVGPVPMMKAVAELTRPQGIETIVSLNPIMIDSTGMCGGCRVQIGSETRFACVDGPEFDAHQVDFDGLSDRLTSYRTEEAGTHSAAECRIGREIAA